MILLSDGRETRGDAGSVLAHVRRLGLQVFPEPTPLFGASTTVWDTLSVAPSVARGAPVGVQLSLYRPATSATIGELTISLAGIPVKRQRVIIQPGWQVLGTSVHAMQQGTMALDVHLTIPEDRIDERRAAYTTVEGPAHVLVVAEQPTNLPFLASALKQREMDIALARPRDLPSQAGALLEYDAVLLIGVPKSAVGADQAEALRGYLEHFGGGLVMVGMGGNIADEIRTSAPLDALLPVTYEAKGFQEATRRVCLVMLIDRSASMMGPRLAATKRAAVELVNQLQPEDLVGVLTFDTQPYIIVEVQSAQQASAVLIEKLVRLRSSGGTDVLPALLAAQDRLELTGATLKHILLLSDGNTPFDADKYRALTAQLRQQHITISTIGIGAAFVNADYLEWLAGSTGGMFYSLRHLEELPQLIARDTQQQLGRLPFTEGFFRPRRSETTDWFADTDVWPPLRGYLTATAKAGASVDLVVPTRVPYAQAEDTSVHPDDPLLARWSVGRGRAVVFTSDADARWAPDWVRWPGFEGWWAQVVRWAMRPRFSEELFLWVDERRGAPRLVVEGALNDPTVSLVEGAEASSRPLSLVQTGQWRWEASLEQVPSGWHELTLESKEGEHSVYATRWIQVGTPPVLEERPGQPPRTTWLRQVAQATDGAYAMPDQAFVPPTTTGLTVHARSMWWLPLVVLLVLVDVALRGASML